MGIVKVLIGSWEWGGVYFLENASATTAIRKARRRILPDHSVGALPDVREVAVAGAHVEGLPADQLGTGGPRPGAGGHRRHRSRCRRHDEPSRDLKGF